MGVFDAGETFAAHGQVLLAPGTDDSSDTAPLVLRSAARAGAAAVVVRRAARPARIRGCWRRPPRPARQC
ncbi:hypothetical protein IHE61_27870 [Streptomyces sp. GKU 257-1]|nr:hypothetical protein [Streptomyces sp. GKU 257-1]